MKQVKPVKFSTLPRRAIEVDGKPVHVVEALGSCGFGTDSKVEVAHIKGVALFVFDGPSVPDNLAPFYTCVVTGMMSCGGASREEALAEGVRRARTAIRDELDREITFGRLQEMALLPAARQAT